MLHFLYNIISDLLMSISLSEQLHFMSVVVVLMLFSSPGAVATIMAFGIKLGIFSYTRDQKRSRKEEAAG